MRIAFSQFDHGPLQGKSLGKALLEAGVERDHKLFRAAVVDIPETQDQGLRPSLEKAADQAHDFVAGPDDVQTRGATAQSNQLGGKL